MTTDGSRGIPPEYLDTITTGDCRELSKAIPDASVDLVFTDPIYQNIDDYRWLAETAARVLKEGGNLVAFCANKDTIDVGNIFTACGLDFCDILIYREMARRRKRWDKQIIGLYEAAVWASKGEGRLGKYVKNFAYVANGYIKTDEHHDWAKEPEGITGWIWHLSESIVFDPFCGGGTVPAVCKMLGRHYIGFEIMPDVAERARQRVALTQVPLPMEIPEQMELMP